MSTWSDLIANLSVLVSKTDCFNVFLARVLGYKPDQAFPLVKNPQQALIQRKIPIKLVQLPGHELSEEALAKGWKSMGVRNHEFWLKDIENEKFQMRLVEKPGSSIEVKRSTGNATEAESSNRKGKKRCRDSDSDLHTSSDEEEEQDDGGEKEDNIDDADDMGGGGGRNEERNDDEEDENDSASDD